MDSGSDVKLGGYPLMDIVASLKPKTPSKGILTTAIDFGDLRAAAALLDHGANINEKDAGGNEPLHAAAINRESGAEAIRLLMRHGVFFDTVRGNIASVDVLNKEKDTPFF